MTINIPEIIYTLPSYLRRHKIVQFLLWMSPDSNIQLVNFNGNSKLYADISDPSPRQHLLLKKFEPEFFSVVKPFLANGGVFFDVGANWGFCSFGLIGCLPDQRSNIKCHLFEANSRICEILSKSTLLHTDCSFCINNCCVTNQKGISKLKISTRQSGESFISDEGEQLVQNLVLDDYIQKQGIQKINLMKLDIEGWEPLALKGCFNSLKMGIIDAIYTEFISEHLVRSGFNLKSFGTFLENANYQLFYCRSSELESSFVDRSSKFDINVNQHRLKLANLDINKIPSEMHTGIRNILAIHKKSQYLYNS